MAARSLKEEDVDTSFLFSTIVPYTNGAITVAHNAEIRWRGWTWNAGPLLHINPAQSVLPLSPPSTCSLLIAHRRQVPGGCATGMRDALSFPLLFYGSVEEEGARQDGNGMYNMTKTTRAPVAVDASGTSMDYRCSHHWCPFCTGE